MYPRNAASPPTIAIGTVVQISDGAVQTTGASARVKIGTGSFAASAGTLACDTTSGLWHYTPSQAETNAESFLVVVYKASCLPCSATVVTSASATGGYAGVDWSKVTNATSTVGLSGTTISTSQAVASVSGAVGSVTGNVGGSVASVTGAVGSVTGNVGGSVASVTGAVGSVTGNVGGNVTGSVGSVVGGINTGSGTITTLDALDTAQDSQHATTQAAIPSAASVADAVLDEALSGHVTAGTLGKAIGDGVTAWVTATGFSTHSAADVWAVGTRALTDKAGFTISGTITTLDDLDTAQDAQHSTTLSTVLSVSLGVSTLTTRLGTPQDLGTGASVAANLVDTKGVVDNVESVAIAVQTDTNELQTDWTNGGRLDLLLDSVLEDTGTTLPASIAALQTDLDTVTDTGVTVVALSSAAITDVWSTDTLVESYRAQGAAGTAAQLLYELLSHVTEVSIAGTTKTTKKVDGSTTAATYTLDDGTTPTSITRAT